MSTAKCVFVTVGSTKFDDLAHSVLSTTVLEALHARQFRKMVLQCGNSDVKEYVRGSTIGDHQWRWNDETTNIEVSVWRFNPELSKYFREADLVISHAGSGTILEVLRLPKPLIVVPNETLLDNHQVELADALSELGHLFSATPRTLPKAIAAYDESVLKEFPQFDGSKFSAIMDEEMVSLHYKYCDSCKALRTDQRRLSSTMAYQQQYHDTFQQGHQPAGSVGYDYRNQQGGGHQEFNPYSDHNNIGYNQPVQQPYHDDFDNTRPGMSTFPSQANFGPDEAEKPERVPRPPGTRNPEGARFSANSFIPPKSTGDIRLWRHDEHRKMWTKGSRARCFGRFCCCTVMTTVFLIVSIVLTLGLWVRPPDISFNGIRTPTNGSTVEAQTSGILINLNLAIGVVNPNFFAADFSAIQAKAFYPGVTEQIGGGLLENINFPSHSDTTFLFPFSINYTEAIDPNRKIIQDIAVKCGFIGNSKSDIPVDYKLTLKLKIAGVTISPSFSGSASFACPLKASDISGLGIDLSGLLNGS
ncbi:hypothetical protein RHS01_02649 [Rhizoctonia solani]|uniref:UDP-N-acetylglucosamine transferase subunit ALG13 n=1 Tax=Rhizoctonia solani TaxID=456999 RepID=A0A8H7IIM3_9AGAM|nr:hypothetical protein RHS01_02649 [Rhizoctonia solani]